MRWEIAEKYDEKKDIIDSLLKSRGIKDKDSFLNPPPILTLTKSLPKDFQNNAKKAKQIIVDATKKGIPIVIHGDYDADGVCATAILHRVIRNELSYENCFSFIPNRFEHGYGLSISSLDACKAKLVEKLGKFEKGLLITVDSGITSVDEIEYAKKLGFDVIVTDHHQKPDKLPPADCVVWSDSFVGAGIAWILGKLLGSKDKRLIGLAALATVTDLQELLNFNRSIVKEGLVALNKDPVPGITALQEASGRQRGDITTYDLGWVLGPRLNASGRIGDADLALGLLLEDDKQKASMFARQLNEINVTRQDKTMQMYELAGDIDETNLPKVILTANKNYHEGIIGLVAAKLTQSYFRPSIVISLDGGFGKGSVRSVKGVDIITFLREFEDLFENVGGHPMAAGFTIKIDNIERLQKKLEEHADKHILDEHLEPTLNVDMQIPLEIVDIKFANKLEKLKPFGIGNKEPVFLSENVRVVDVNKVGRDGTHLSLKFSTNSKTFKGIFFGGTQNHADLEVGDKVDVVYVLRKSEFRNREYVNVVVKDLKVI